jgi:hypothetical protein
MIIKLKKQSIISVEKEINTSITRFLSRVTLEFDNELICFSIRSVFLIISFRIFFYK